MTAEQLDFIIDGMDCPDCALQLEKSVANLEGVALCDINYATAKMRVQGSAAAEDVAGRVAALGYKAILANDAPRWQPRRSGVVGFAQFLLARAETRLALAGGCCSRLRCSRRCLTRRSRL
ncbi:MAG: heavy-metal-associated domain-containing protein [Anaerolineae bacterium]|nr:heavy-metal-associated domain-containing protein [Anaerolineae bacterium]